MDREVHRLTSAPVPAVVVKPETLSDICDLFEKSYEHTKCSTLTQHHRETALKIVREKWGNFQRGALSDRRFRGDVLSWRDEMMATPSMADLNIQSMQRLMAWAYDRGKVEFNHLTRIPPLAEKQRRAEKGVTAAQHEALLATGSPDEIRLYLFARYTAMRRADLCLVQWSDIAADGWLQWMHSKTKKTTKAVSFYPTFALPQLARLLDEIPRVGPHILTTHTGRQWTGENINNRWQAWKLRAKLVDADLHFHDLRGQCIQDMVDADCTVPQAASISGHAVAGTNVGSFSAYAARSRPLALAAYTKLASYLDTEASSKKVVRLRRA